MTNTQKICFALATLTALINAAWAGEGVSNQGITKRENRIPSIMMENVPLREGIRSLARQAQIKYILDPRIVGPGGLYPTEPTLTFRWENVSAEEALRKVLKEHQLAMIVSPATSVTRIAPTNAVAQPVAMSQVGSDKMKPIPLIVMEDVPLSDAIKNLARQSGLNALFSPEVNALMERRPTVSFRWENITPRQALAAVLDNYELMLVEEQSDSIARIKLKI